MLRRRATAYPVCLLAVVALAAFIVGAPRGARSAAQESPEATVTFAAPVEVYLSAYAELDILPVGPATLIAENVIVPPAQEIETLPKDGPVLISLRAGTAVVDADEAIVILNQVPVGVMQPATPSPEILAGRLTRAGEQILLANGTTARLRNTGAAPATFLVISIAAKGTPASSA